MEPRDLPASWPFRSAGRRLRAAGHDWWLVDTGPPAAPAVLLLHGLGASGHSFRRMIPGLSARYRVLVPDLPGQGCSHAGRANRLGLEPMAEDLGALCDVLGVAPVAVIGHSAGAAIALQMARMRPIPAVVGINAALGHFGGAATAVFGLMARGMAALPFVAPSVARVWASRSRVDRLLDQTGSTLDAEGRAQYLALVRDPGHIAGALGMMAAWRLDPLLAALPALPVRTLLIAAAGDVAVPPSVSHQAAARMPRAEVRDLPGGHLVHEEAEDGLAGLILDWLQPETVSPKII